MTNPCSSHSDKNLNFCLAELMTILCFTAARHLPNNSAVTGFGELLSNGMVPSKNHPGETLRPAGTDAQWRRSGTLGEPCLFWETFTPQ